MTNSDRSDNMESSMTLYDLVRREDKLLATKKPHVVRRILNWFGAGKARQEDFHRSGSGWIVFERPNLREIHEAERFYANLLNFAGLNNYSDLLMFINMQSQLSLGALKPERKRKVPVLLDRIRIPVQTPYFLEEALGVDYGDLSKLESIEDVHQCHTVHHPKTKEPVCAYDTYLSKFTIPNRGRLYHVKIEYRTK